MNPSDTLKAKRRLLLTIFSPAVLVILFVYSASFAQESKELLLREIQTAYEELDYQEAEIKADAALRDYESYSSDQLAEIHKILGLVYFSQNLPDKSSQQFRLALSLKPELELDALLVSPKILSFFETIKSESADLTPDVREEPAIRYVRVEDQRPSAAWRSLLAPGWGQVYKGQSTKGYVLASLWGVGLIGTVATHLLRQSAEDDYLMEIDPVRIEDRYQTFNRYHKARTALAIFTGAVWAFGYFDALLVKNQSEKAGLGVSLRPSADLGQNVVQVEFRMGL